MSSNGFDPWGLNITDDVLHTRDLHCPHESCGHFTVQGWNSRALRALAGFSTSYPIHGNDSIGALIFTCPECSKGFWTHASETMVQFFKNHSLNWPKHAHMS